MSSRSLASALVNVRAQTSTQRSLLVVLWLSVLAALHRSRAENASHELQRYRHLIHKEDDDTLRVRTAQLRELLPREW